MFDYKLIEALAMVVREGGFENAARALHITQSAVSQRVKMLEELTGQVLIARTTPPQATSTLVQKQAQLAAAWPYHLPSKRE